MLLRLAYLTVTNTFAALRLLPMGDLNKDVEILALRHQITVLERQLGADRFKFAPRTEPFSPPFSPGFRAATSARSATTDPASAPTLDIRGFARDARLQTKTAQRLVTHWPAMGPCTIRDRRLLPAHEET
ncbi:hypothetical protein AB0K00_31180 [Dactylosporangium sp. NPDC049525]|uniref:hypothetical protein n=1 Tax=Dactylosporangium sp. NPDC049525 TaxID=3154730 RepID=UPI00342806FC